MWNINNWIDVPTTKRKIITIRGQKNRKKGKKNAVVKNKSNSSSAEINHVVLP
jgi:hypothetical protein